MSQRTIRRLCVLVVLALSLAFAVPGRADAAPLTAADLWRWVENFLQERLVHLGRAESPEPSRHLATPGSYEKNCTTVDPNGCPNHPGGAGGSSTSGGGG